MGSKKTSGITHWFFYVSKKKKGEKKVKKSVEATSVHEFVELALNSEESFFLRLDVPVFGLEQYCFPITCGKGKYIYGLKIQEGHSFGSNTNAKPMALVADGEVYLISWVFNGVKVPNACQMTTKARQLNKEVDRLTLELFRDLSASPLPESEERRAQEYARNILLKKDTSLKILENELAEPFLKVDSAKTADYLCGFCTLEKDVVDSFQENIRGYANAKAVLERVKELLSSPYPDIVGEYEVELAEAINALEDMDAKFVTVEFSYHGRTGSAKIGTKNLKKILVGGDWFSDYQFQTIRQGEELFSILGVNPYGEEADPLRCWHISKITYGRRTLYEQKRHQGEMA